MEFYIKHEQNISLLIHMTQK